MWDLNIKNLYLNGSVGTNLNDLIKKGNIEWLGVSECAKD